MADRPETQEQSIKARKSLLFEVDEKADAAAKVVRKPFSELLRTTPAAPLSMPWKALLGVLGLIVVALLAAALTSSGKSKAKARPKSSPAKTARREPGTTLAVRT